VAGAARRVAPRRRGDRHGVARAQRPDASRPFIEAGRTGARARAVDHFRHNHRLQPDNWTYKRQAWSLAGQERLGGECGRFVQGPLKGEEGAWPHESDFLSDVAVLDEGACYPKTI
jgi:hypothetical protein